LIDYTPEIYQRALEVARNNNLFVPMFNPPTHVGDPAGPAIVCPSGSGGVNITGAPVADPVAGVIFISSQSNCGALLVAPGVESPLDGPEQTGVTHSDWSSAQGQGGGAGRWNEAGRIDGLSIWKGPVGRISAIDLNTGEY
ncbi:MAG TPA: hypothetical protein DCF71_15740, partial [Gemmatimonadetes bacterium]|nr:hypothetical protein [Gemmatimonadota bacterium]